MSIINATPLLAAAGGDYQISRSVRLRSSASAYFNRTPASAGDYQKWTWSGWIKLGNLSVASLFSAQHGSGTDASVYTAIYYINNRLELQRWNGATYQIQVASNNLLRDPSAWYHFVVTVDTPQATAANRVKLYINGIETSYSTATYPSQNFNTDVNTTQRHALGALVRLSPNNFSSFFDGYLTEINFIDGQALTPSSFGETDAVTGVWKPKKYAGTYGTNGFYLNFSDPSAATAAAIGKDYSGNGNNWTPNNISVTSGVTYDSMLDVPTPYADGGNGRGNYAVLNPLDKAASASVLNGNLRVTSGSATALGSRGTFQIPTTGKWYYEGVVVNSPSGSTPIEFGCATDSASLTALQATGSYGIYVSSAISYMNNGTASGSLGSLTAGDIIQFAGDCDNGRIWIGKNNVYWDASSGTTGNPSSNSNPTLSVSPASMFPLFLAYNNSLDANFGQRPFAYTPPTGFVALNTQNLPESTIKNGGSYFDATTFIANGTTQAITNSGFQPDALWFKRRDAAGNHFLFNSVVGDDYYLVPNLTDAEGTSAAFISSLNSNGFTMGTGNYANGISIVCWNWKKGATQGFDIVTYTGTGANRTVAHSLGVAPSMMIVKSRSSGADGWPVFHSSVGNGSALVLNSTSAINTNSVWWNNTSPSSSVFTVGTNTGVNGNAATYVAYLFAEVAGFSKFGSVSMNGSADGAFVFTGFLPKFVMLKRTDSTSNWIMWDTVRNTYNVVGEELYPNLSNAASTVTDLDMLSNGFKMRNSGFSGTWIYAAFADVPFRNSLAR